jgi:colanic acid biosynthesis protein WcaH
MELSTQQFLEVIKNTPLIAIDIIVRNKDNKILLFLRKNEPAKNTWFVPGGRIRKDETLDDAFKRITKNELGREYSRNKSRFIGVFENIYDKNFLGIDEVRTHYIVLTYEIRPSEIPEKFPTDQHKEHGWFSKTDLRNTKRDDVIHPYVHPYFDILC